MKPICDVDAFGDVVLRACKWKCFVTSEDLSALKAITIIIGKNNVGKSSLLEIIEYCVNGIPNDEQTTMWSSDSEISVNYKSLNDYLAASLANSSTFRRSLDITKDDPDLNAFLEGFRDTHRDH